MTVAPTTASPIVPPSASPTGEGDHEVDPAGGPAALRHLLAPRRNDYRPAGTAVVVGALGQLAGVGLLASSAWLITTASLRPPVLTLTVAIAAVQCFALSRGVARYVERLASHDLAFRILARLRVWAFARVEPLVPARWPGVRRGDLLSRFVADVDGLQDLYVRSLLPLVASVGAATITALTAFLLDPVAGAVLAAGLLVGAVGMPALAAALGARGGRHLTEWRGRRDALVVEILHAVDDLAAFGALTDSLVRLEGAERQVARGARRAAQAAGLGAASSVGLSGVLAAAVIAASLPDLGHGAVTGVTVAVLAFLGFAGGEVVSGLPEAFAGLAGTLAGARRIASVAGGAAGTETGGAVVGAAGAVRAAGAEDGGSAAVAGGAVAAESVTAPRSQARAGGPQPAISPTPADVPVSPARHVPDVELRDVTVSYEPGREPALHHVDLHLDPGCHLALVGPSGAGKTTLGHLLLRFVDADHGQVTVDGIDVRDLDPDLVRRSVAWAPQDPHVFHATLAVNLRLARPDVGDGDLVAVLERLGLGPWLATLPDGLGTVLGERGTSVSGGERQRLGLARALLADRPVLLLDEPTAHLDQVNATLVRDVVLGAATGKTLVWITHHPAEQAAFDRTATLDRGSLTCSSSTGGRTGTDAPQPRATS